MVRFRPSCGPSPPVDFPAPDRSLSSQPPPSLVAALCRVTKEEDEDGDAPSPMGDREWHLKYVSALLYCVCGNKLRATEREWCAHWVRGREGRWMGGRKAGRCGMTDFFFLCRGISQAPLVFLNIGNF